MNRDRRSFLAALPVAAGALVLGRAASAGDNASVVALPEESPLEKEPSCWDRWERHCSLCDKQIWAGELIVAQGGPHALCWARVKEAQARGFQYEPRIEKGTFKAGHEFKPRRLNQR